MVKARGRASEVQVPHKALGCDATQGAEGTTKQDWAWIFHHPRDERGYPFPFLFFFFPGKNVLSCFLNSEFYSKTHNPEILSVSFR